MSEVNPVAYTEALRYSGPPPNLFEGGTRDLRAPSRAALIRFLVDLAALRDAALRR